MSFIDNPTGLLLPPIYSDFIWMFNSAVFVVVVVVAQLAVIPNAHMEELASESTNAAALEDGPDQDASLQVCQRKDFIF